MSEQNQNGYPKIICEKCSVQMDVIGIGSATGRLKYHCSTCGVEQWGKNPAAMALGSLGGKARAQSLSSEERHRIAEKAGNANADRLREKKRNQ